MLTSSVYKRSMRTELPEHYMKGSKTNMVIFTLELVLVLLLCLVACLLRANTQLRTLNLPHSLQTRMKKIMVFLISLSQMVKPLLGIFIQLTYNPARVRKDRDIQLNQIVEKMQSDCLNTQNDSFPFFLCGNLSPTELGTDLIHSCFQGTDHHKQASEYALLLKSLPSFRTQGVSEGHTIDSVMIRANQSIGLLTNLKEIVKSSTPLAMREVIQREDDLLILCGEVSGSAKSDTDGSSSVEGRVSYENEESRYEVEVSGRVDRDSDGNYSGEVRVDFSKEF